MKKFWNVYEKLCGRLWDLLPGEIGKKFGVWLWSLMPDNCQVCHGKSGGVRGNENRIDDIVMCDYCTAKLFRERDQVMAREA